MAALKPTASESHALTSTPQGFTAPARQDNPRLSSGMLLRVFGTVNFHVAVGAAPTATVDDMPVTDHLHGQIIQLDAGEKLSVIKATGEPDGTVWFTTVRRH